jgi:hypothetical protein
MGKKIGPKPGTNPKASDPNKKETNESDEMRRMHEKNWHSPAYPHRLI